LKDEGKMAGSPKQLTVTMFSMKVLQLLKLQIPFSRFRLVPDIEFKTNLVQLLYLFRVHSTFFEDGTLLVDPIAQLWVKAVTSRHFTCNEGREAGRELVGVFKDERKTIGSPQQNSQWPCFP
jgi:hypothetical protein